MSTPSAAEPPPTACDWCGREFHPEARNFVESGISMENLGEDWQGTSDETMDDDKREHFCGLLQITREQIDTLLRDGYVETGASVICTECQDVAQHAADQENPNDNPNENNT
jgi:hypothetical protein